MPAISSGDIGDIAQMMMSGGSDSPRPKIQIRGNEPDESPPEIVMMPPGLQVPEIPRTPTSISASKLRQLFPGPGLMMEEDMAPMAMPFGSPDIAVMDMLKMMDEAFAQTVLPMAHRAASAGRTPDSCGPYIRH